MAPSRSPNPAAHAAAGPRTPGPAAVRAPRGPAFSLIARVLRSGRRRELIGRHPGLAPPDGRVAPAPLLVYAFAEELVDATRERMSPPPSSSRQTTCTRSTRAGVRRTRWASRVPGQTASCSTSAMDCCSWTTFGSRSSTEGSRDTRGLVRSPGDRDASRGSRRLLTFIPPRFRPSEEAGRTAPEGAGRPCRTGPHPSARLRAPPARTPCPRRCSPGSGPGTCR